MGPRAGFEPAPEAPQAPMLAITPPRTMIPETSGLEPLSLAGKPNLPRSSTFVENSFPLSLTLTRLPKRSPSCLLMLELRSALPLESIVEVNLADSSLLGMLPFQVKAIPYEVIHLSLLSPSSYYSPTFLKVCGKSAQLVQFVQKNLRVLDSQYALCLADVRPLPFRVLVTQPELVLAGQPAPVDQ